MKQILPLLKLVNTSPEWEGFSAGDWRSEINVQDFISKNVSPYLGDDQFLCRASDKTEKLWKQVKELMIQEIKKGVLDADTEVVSSIVSHAPGYINKDLETIVGLQTEKPLKRALMPNGGYRMAMSALEAFGYKMSPATEEIFSKHRKTHNEGVFDVYTKEMKDARKSGIITGLPDAYGRGRIIGDYRRVALYGIDLLLQAKSEEKLQLEYRNMDEDTIRLREELSEQMRALQELKTMAKTYGFDIGRPASNATEAVQWTYFAYLGATKEQNGAAMSLGRVSSFLDIYIERDLKNAKLTEYEAQEIMDQFVMKLRMIRFARTPEYNDLFSGDPNWVTECVGGMALNGTTLVTKNSFRVLQTLYNLGPAPEPNLTVLWSESLPKGFKEFCAKVSIDTSSVQYESDDLMRPMYGTDYAIACCVSAMKVGKQMQFFGARANMAKCLLYSINGGKDEVSGEQVGPLLPVITDEVLNFDMVMERYDVMMDWLANLYVNTLNVIHYMHDKYCYERLEMALHERDIERKLATGIAGLSVVADSLSAIRYAKVYPVRNAQGLVTDFRTEGEFPKYGNNDERVDLIAKGLVKKFNDKLLQQKTYRNSNITMSVLTITSNVVYGKKTGSTPDGRKKGEAFAPGANPMHGRDTHGALASMASVAQLPYASAQDGISNTFSVVPTALGRNQADQVDNLTNILDGYFKQGGHHINVNVLNRETLLEAMDHPEKHPQLTIRVSGYAVNFVKLTREQQLEVINRTFHQYM